MAEARQRMKAAFAISGEELKDGEHHMERQPVTSAFVKSVGFDQNVLEVELVNGQVYRYPGFAVAAYEELMGAKSFGRAFGTLVRGLPYERVDPASESTRG